MIEHPVKSVDVEKGGEKEPDDLGGLQELPDKFREWGRWWRADGRIGAAAFEHCAQALEKELNEL